MELETLKSKIEQGLGSLASSVVISAQGEVVVTVSAANYLKVAEAFKSKPEFSFEHLSSLTAVDYIKENKITVVSHLWSYKHLVQITVKVEVDRAVPVLPTLENVWKSANWFEREVFDLYGVKFEGHSDLRRIMMPDDYTKYPLRKDFTDDGFITKPN